MKKRALPFLAFLLFAASCFAAELGPRAALWKRVDDALRRGLPGTAITNLDPIINGAMNDKAYAEAAKALARKITLEGSKPEEKVLRLRGEVAKAPPEMAPVLDTLLAHWYLSYYRRNIWRFLQRTATSQPLDGDFPAWDLPRLLEEVDRRFQSALTAEAMLKATPISAWDDLIEKGTMPDGYRPTLYDFIVREMAEFYASADAMARPEAETEDAFEISASDPIFDSAALFAAWRPDTTDAASLKLKTLRLFQALLQFHQNDSAPKLAFAAADLDRLVWGSKAPVGKTRDERSRRALDAFAAEHEDQEISALALEYGARIFQREGDLLAAHDWAARGERRFPTSPGGKLCRALILELEAKELSVSSERAWGAPWPKLSIRYRNVSVVHFRVIPLDWEKSFAKENVRVDVINDEARQEILAKTPALQWSVHLPPADDYKERTFDIPAPEKLKTGYYIVAAGLDPGFSGAENAVSLMEVWVTDLALVLWNQADRVEGLVTRANSGEPVSGAEITAWHEDANGVAGKRLKTGSDGSFSVKADEDLRFFRARFRGQEIVSMGDNSWSLGGDELEKPGARTLFFSDRAIYRPGQSIQYKGICLWVDQAKGRYEVLKNENVTVVFRDGNRKEIARQHHRANDYGSFSGSFTAPQDRLTGGMSIHTEGRAEGETYIRIEEYKRPKFVVTLDAPGAASKLNEKIHLIGHAVSYSGVAVGGARVRYRVTREVRIPWWGSWGARFSASGRQRIAHGVVRTEKDGLFRIEFVALPDRKVPATNEPSFDFQIEADVTDASGETRSAERSIRVGYAALEAELTADGWQTAVRPVTLNIGVRTLDGEPQVADGVVRIYALLAPAKIVRAPIRGFDYWAHLNSPDQENDLSIPDNWPLGSAVFECAFTTGTNGSAALSVNLAKGVYRAILETRDSFGRTVAAQLPLYVLDPAASRLDVPIPLLLAAPKWEVEPGGEFTALWGTGYDRGRAFVEVECRNRILQRFWTKAGRTQQIITVPVTEAMRGGFTLRIAQVRENRLYPRSVQVGVPWENKKLTLKWEHFTSKLLPMQKESWTLLVHGPSAQQAGAEMVASLYDESLDLFERRDWLHRFDCFRHEQKVSESWFANTASDFLPPLRSWRPSRETVKITYRHFPADLAQGLWGAAGSRLGIAMNSPVASAAPAPPMLASMGAMPSTGQPPGDRNPGGAEQSPKPDLTEVVLRKNLQETAFFFPQATSDSNGIVRLTFTMPEALTKWRFKAFAHDPFARSGYLEAHVVTAKDLMVQPNPPRFLREGDTVEFMVKVSNQSDARQTGVVRLTFNDALRDSATDAALGNTKPEQDFDLPARESRSFGWRIHVPDGCGFLTYKAVAASAALSDGEEGPLPVLSRRSLVTESLPLSVRGPSTNQFRFEKLLQSGQSHTQRHESLSAQMVSQPAWYAVLALPYLMEPPFECSEQTFNRLYGNALAQRIATRDPKIRRVFDLWKNTPALDSPLTKNQDLKSVIIEETPWLQDAQDESQARHNIGVLFDGNRVQQEIDTASGKLAAMQLADGRWPWFPGGLGNDYITLYITAGFGRLRGMNIEIKTPALAKALSRLDEWMAERYSEIGRSNRPDEYVPSPTVALYLYGRSFFLHDLPIGPSASPAVLFFLGQGRKFWLETDCRQSQAQIALALNRWGGAENVAAARAIMQSLRERSVSSEEMGMFWRDTESSWWWHRAPIETQAFIIEAFDEVVKDQAAVDDCRVWLLKQKQTQNWKTTKATADAVYALLLRGTNLLSSDALAQMRLGSVDVTPIVNPTGKVALPNPSQPEPGSGFYQRRFSPSEIKPEFGEIRVVKGDAGVSWGGVHWRYFEDMDKITPHEGSPLKLTKTLFVKTATKNGPVLEPLRGEVRVGDELVVRLELRTDRDLEYVHLKDQRGSGLEPINVLSQYKRQNGIVYYESTRDTASHFFCDYLPQGTHVFEYSARVQLRGEYQSGIAEIQCMYAPEFNSHSQSILLTVLP